MANTLTSTDLLRLLETAQDYLLDSTIGFVRAYQVRESKKPGPDDFVADLGDLLKRAGQVAGQFAAHRVKLKPNRAPLYRGLRSPRFCRMTYRELGGHDGRDHCRGGQKLAS